MRTESEIQNNMRLNDINICLQRWAGFNQKNKEIGSEQTPRTCFARDSDAMNSAQKSQAKRTIQERIDHLNAEILELTNIKQILR